MLTADPSKINQGVRTGIDPGCGGLARHAPRTEPWGAAVHLLMDLGVSGQRTYEIVTWLRREGQLVRLCEKAAATMPLGWSGRHWKGLSRRKHDYLDTRRAT